MNERREGAANRLRKAADRVVLTIFGMWGKGEIPGPLQDPLIELGAALDEL